MPRAGIAFAIATVLFASRASAAEGDEETPPKEATAPLKITPTGYVEVY